MQDLNELEFHHRMESTSGIALAILTAPACSACQALERAVEELLRRGERLSVLRIDAVHNMGLVRELEVQHLPAMFLYRDGSFHCELHSRTLPNALRNAIREALERPPQEAP